MSYNTHHLVTLQAHYQRFQEVKSNRMLLGKYDLIGPAILNLYRHTHIHIHTYIHTHTHTHTHTNKHTD